MSMLTTIKACRLSQYYCKRLVTTLALWESGTKPCTTARALALIIGHAFGGKESILATNSYCTTAQLEKSLKVNI